MHGGSTASCLISGTGTLYKRGGAAADPFKSDQLSTAICAEERAKACASTSDIMAGHTLCCVPILEHGTEEQKRKYLPMLTTGGVLGGMGITEPNAGSDASKSQTQARLAGDHYVINDSKIFSSRTAPKRACSSSSP